MSRAILAIPVFFLTLAGGLAFLQLIADAHFYHQLIDQALLGQGHQIVRPDSDSGLNNWRSNLRASDVRKIGHVADSFEPTVIENLGERVRLALTMDHGDDREHAVAELDTLVKSNRDDLIRLMHALMSLRNSDVEGVEVEFSDVDVSIGRLKATIDVLAAVSAELNAGADDVILHGLQKQLSDAFNAMKTKAGRAEKLHRPE